MEKLEKHDFEFLPKQIHGGAVLRLALGTYTHSGGQPRRKRHSLTRVRPRRVVALLARSCFAASADVPTKIHVHAVDIRKTEYTTYRLILHAGYA